MVIARRELNRWAKAQYERIRSRDALFVATALNRGIERVVSPDRHFDGIPGLTRVDPADEEAVAALSASSG